MPGRMARSPYRRLHGSATHEVPLVPQTLAEDLVAALDGRLMGDNAHDSDRLDRDLATAGGRLLPSAAQSQRRDSGQIILAVVMGARRKIAANPSFAVSSRVCGRAVPGHDGRPKWGAQLR